MKHKLSISIKEENVLGILDLLRTGSFRNKSHVVEYAVEQLLRKGEK